MRRSTATVACAIGAVSLLASCSSDSSDPFVPSAELLEVAECTGTALQPVGDTFTIIIEDLEVRTTATGYTAMFVVGPVTYTVNATPTVLAGDLSDGFSLGDIVQVDWTLTGTNSATGSGTFTFDFQAANLVTAAGDGSFANGTCTFTITAVDLSGDPTTPDFDTVGTIDFTTSTGGDLLTGTIMFDLTDIATVNATFQNVNVVFRIDLTTYTVMF